MKIIKTASHTYYCEILKCSSRKQYHRMENIRESVTAEENIFAILNMNLYT